MLKVSKILLLSLLVVSLCAPMALATTSRVQALAGASRYINDDSDIFRWYGTLPSYSKMVMAEAGMATGDLEVSYQALGLTHDWGEDHWLGTWSIYLLQNSIQDPSLFLYNPLGTPLMNLDPADPTLMMMIPSTKFALGWGKQFEKVALGATFTRSDGSVEAEGDKFDVNFMTIGAGVRWDVNEDFYLDASGAFGTAGGDVLGEGWDKKSSYNLEGRGFWEFRDNVSLVPYVGFASSDFSLQDFAAPTGDKMNEIALGAALNMDVNTNNLLIVAMEFEHNKWEFSNSGDDQSKLTGKVLPRFLLALESDITSWFTMRVGASKTMTEYTFTAADGSEYKVTDLEWLLSMIPEGEDPPDEIPDLSFLDDFQWHLGVGFHVAEWDIDAVLSHETPFRMGYWLTGYQPADAEPPVGRISATYRF